MFSLVLWKNKWKLLFIKLSGMFWLVSYRKSHLFLIRFVSTLLQCNTYVLFSEIAFKVKLANYVTYPPTNQLFFAHLYFINQGHLVFFFQWTQFTNALSLVFPWVFNIFQGPSSPHMCLDHGKVVEPYNISMAKCVFFSFFWLTSAFDHLHPPC